MDRRQRLYDGKAKAVFAMDRDDRVIIHFKDDSTAFDGVKFARLEIGRSGGRVLLADAIPPDGSRLWETGTGRHFDKDVFRRDLADFGDTCRALHARQFGS